MLMDGVRYRVAFRFTVWRLMAMVACVAFSMSILHDAGNPDTLDVSWPTLVAMMVLNLCLLAGFAALFWNIVRQITRLVTKVFRLPKTTR
jgi:hypothetical protein